MANQLVVGIGADSSKLTAELAIAKQKAIDFGKDLRDAVKGGDDDKINAAAKNYDDEIKNVAKLGAAVKAARNAGNEDGEKTGIGGWLATAQAAFGRMQTAMAPVKEGLSELHSRARDFGNALSNVASNIFPSFKEVFAIGAIGSGAALISMVRSTAEWGHELQKNADTLGVTVNEMAGLKKAAKEIGVDGDALIRGLTRFSVAFDKAGEDQKKLAIEATQILYSNVQRMGGGIADMTKRTEDGLKRVFKVGDADFSKIGDQIKQAYNLGGIAGVLPGETFESFSVRAQTGLRGVGKEADKLREIIFKMGGDISAGNLSTALDRGVKGYRDVFKTLGVSITDANGNMRKFTDTIVDFVTAFRQLDSGKQASIAKEIEGRGFAEMLPFLKMDPKVLRGFLDEAEKNKGLDVQVKSADALYRALLRLDMALAAVKKALILPFVDVFAGPTAGMEKFVKGMAADVAVLSRSIATALKPIAQDIGNIFTGGKAQTGFGQEFVTWKNTALEAINSIRSAFNGLLRVFDGAAAAINSIFGTNFSGRGLLIAATVVKMTGAFALLTAGVRLLSSALLLLSKNPVIFALTAIGLVALTIYQNWDTISALFQRIWDLMKQVAGYIGGAFATAWNAAVDGIKSAWSGLTTWISGQIDQIIRVVNKIVEVAKQAAGIIAGLGGASSAAASVTPSSGGVSGASSTFGDVGAASLNAAGGYISGPGSGTSDSIPARLSNGEYVLRAASVAKLGVGYLNHLNSAGYAMGGLVGRALGFSPSIPSFAGGGLVGGGSSFGTVNLTFGGQTASLNVSNQDGFGQLSRIARTEQRTSAGAKPSWYGS